MGNIKIPKIFLDVSTKIVAAAIGALISAESFSQTMDDYAALPALSVQALSNQSIMLAMSRDHQLFMKAYNDFSDLTGDDKPDNTYVHDYDYVGYFDFALCYSYVSDIFEAVARRDSVSRKCASGQWSGNFLNWATMTRIDLVRQVLYGGYRYKDQPSRTVLERSYLPSDAHSFAKYVPAEINLDGLAVVSDLPAGECPAGRENEDDRCKGFTFCNTSQPPGPDMLSQKVSTPPLLRVVRGNYMLWDAGERYQCLTTSAYYPSRTPDMPNSYQRIHEAPWTIFIQNTLAIRDESEAKQVFGVLPAENVNVQFDPAGANLNNPDLSGIQAFPRSPLKAYVKDYIVRVSVCDSNFYEGQLGPDEGDPLAYDCKKYGENNYKPVGLLQRYGASPSHNVQFGLLSGSYISNKSFGALRKKISDFSEEINASDGTFKSLDEVPNSIVHNLNALRVVDYLYDYTPDRPITYGEYPLDHPLNKMADYSGTYQSPQTGAAVCKWGQNYFNSSECRNWGNPFSQILAESYRYLTGATNASVNVDSEEEELLTGLSVDDWPESQQSQPTEENQFSCSAKGVLGFNASAVSYDWSNEFKSLTPSRLGIPNSSNDATLADLTNALGRNGNYFIGNNGSGGEPFENVGLCTVKTVENNLGEISGTCPETPRLEGGYLGAGLADYLYKEQGIRTFGVSLTDALPRIKIPLSEDGDAKVQLVPACRNVSTGGNCALMSFKVIEDPIENFERASGRPGLPNGVQIKRAGAYYVAWEDSEQGGDYDVDAAGVIRYELLTNNELVVETELLYNGTPDKLLFGYVISGTVGGADGVKFPAVTPGDWNYLSTLRKGPNSNWRPTNESDGPINSRCTSTNNCEKGGGGDYQRITFAVSTTGGSDADFLPSPLALAAEVGSGIGTDGYAEVDDPSKLRSRLDTILKGLFNALKPGTGASVATNAIAGEGLVMSSLYSPELTNGNGEQISWVGHFNGLFYKDGLFWENCHQPDESAPRVITNDDCVIEIFFDNDSQKTMFKRYKTLVDEEGVVSIDPESEQGPFDYQDLKPLWSANAELSSVSKPLEQRGYGVVDNKKRYIFTAVAKDNRVNVASNDVMPFLDSSFAETTPNTVGLGSRNYRLLGVEDPAIAQDIVKYIRGDETLPNSRSRTINDKKWLLGDIVNSSAALVGRPSATYDIDRIGDATYAAFVNRYRNRRLVAYVGANDGMLHAFNGGFFNYSLNSPGYLTRPLDENIDVKEHALGAELWAYVPYNLLPHLKWLKDPEYSHVYYVDSKVHTFDVNIFSGNEYSAEDYPGGWGTILVVGMRFGGGPYALDTNGDQVPDRTTRSAYVVLDVTNPEKEPRLLAELTDEDLGYTTGDLDIISIRRPNAQTGSFVNPERNEWYLVFGSGPTGANALKKSKSDQEAKVFYVRLNDLTSTTNSNSWVNKISTGISNAYVGGVTAVDWNSDFQTDMLYIGVVGTGNGAGDSRGALMQAKVSYSNALSISTPTRLLNDVHLPFSRAPLVVRDLTNNGYWVYAATGEFMVSDHLLAENIDQNRLFGVRVNDAGGWRQSAGIYQSNLKDISSVEVITKVENNIRSFTVVDPNSDIVTPDQMELEIRENYSGWVKDLRYRPELVLNSPTFSGTTLAVGSFSPSVDECKPEGMSRLYWLNMFTGLPQTENRNIFVRDGSNVKSIDSKGPEGGAVSDHAPPTPGIILGGSKAGRKIIYGDNEGDLSSVDADQNPPSPVRRAWREIPMSELH